MTYFSVTDLFFVGLGLDIIGAVILAKGLLIKSWDIAALATTRWGPHDVRHMASLIENRLNGTYGVAVLVLGFALQIAGYAVAVATNRRFPTGFPVLGVGAGLLIAGAVLAWGAYRIWRGKRLPALVVSVADYSTGGFALGSGPGAREPLLDVLIPLATQVGLDGGDIPPRSADRECRQWASQRLGVQLDDKGFRRRG